MPAFTHFRPAQPVLVAHFFLAHVAVAPARSRTLRGAPASRPTRCRSGPARSPAPATTSTSQALARDLGFSRVVANSIDASSDRDFAATFLYACALTMVHLSRLAEDLIIFCGDEHRFFELSDALSTGSSMMPQKKNPDPLELVRGKTGRALGHLVALLTTMKGLPSGYNKDLQEDKQAVFDAEDTLAGSLAVVTSVVDGLTLNRARAEAAASGLLLATDVADYLVGRGVPFRRAHEIVGALVRKLVAEGREFGSLTLDEWREASELFGADIVDRVTPRVSVAAKRTPQSTAPSAVRDALGRGAGVAWAVAGLTSCGYCHPETSSAKMPPPFAILSPPARFLREFLMQQRQLRLGDILDDYCPRERRVTNHAVVAMVGADVKQTRCTTCDAEHEYKHAKVPRQRRKAETPPALYAQVLAGGPKRVVHESAGEAADLSDDSRRRKATRVVEPPLSGRRARGTRGRRGIRRRSGRASSEATTARKGRCTGR